MSSLALFPCLSMLDVGIVGELSSTLALKVYSDRNLIGEAASRLNSSPERLSKMMYNKTSVFNQFTLEKEKAVNMFQHILSEKLSAPVQYLFFGFLTSLIPPQVTEVLRVLVVDKKARRMEYEIEAGLSKGEAKKKIHKNDVSAFSWTLFLFDKEAYDSSLYDLVIIAKNRGHREITKEIVGSFRKTSVLRTTESQKAVLDMKLMIEVESQLLSEGHKIATKAKDGNVTLVVQNNVLNYSSLQKDLTDIVKQVSGVGKVTIERRKSYVESLYRQQNFKLPSRVLFVDDEREFVQTVSQRLISRDVGTYGVYDGKKALAIIADDRPEVMILDLKMPGMYGVEVLRQAKEMAPEIEVIVLTGHGTTQDREDCMELGAFAYMHKPVDIEELSGTIKAANDKAHGRLTNIV